MAKYKVTISMPVLGRPQRTRRAIDCIMAQTVNKWEALVIGDGCPEFGAFCKSDEARQLVANAAEKGNSLVLHNNKKRHGGWGYQIHNENIGVAQGEYFIFVSNDDIINKTHLENYLCIKNTGYDWLYFDSWVRVNEPPIRCSEIAQGKIGHSELIIKTDFLRRVPPHTNQYGHDFTLVQNMVNAGSLYAKAINRPATYKVMSIPLHIEQGID